MKKIYKIFLTIFAAMFIVLSFGIAPNLKSHASSLKNELEFETEVIAILEDYTKFDERIAGSQGEQLASEYIKNYLTTQTSLTAKNDAYIENGVQSFDFESIFSYSYETSQNIIFEYKAAQQTDKKIIVSCHYDAVAYNLDNNVDGVIEGDIYVASESLNGSAGSVATLLAFAKFLPSLDLKYNIEVVFFGAGESNNAGSNIYTHGIGEDEKKNIVCAINFDTITLGKNLYFYIDEIDNDFSKLVSKIAYNNKLSTKQVNTFNLNKVLLTETNELGLDYMHIAMASDNYNLKKAGIETINLFAGDYSKGIAIGKCEFENEDAVSYTENDNRAFVTEKFGEKEITKNLYEAYRTVCLTLTDADLETAVTGAEKSTYWFNMIFANHKLASYLTIVAFFVFVIIGMYVFYKLAVKSYKARVELEFVTSVMKISENLAGEDIDEKTAKAISQVLANDINKDKRKQQKKDKNKKS